MSVRQPSMFIAIKIFECAGLGTDDECLYLQFVTQA